MSMSHTDHEHLAQVTHSLHKVLSEEDFDRLVDRMLWAIHASPGLGRFNDEWFRARCKGEAFIKQEDTT